MELKVLMTITVVMTTYMVVGGIIFQKIETAASDGEFTTKEIFVHSPISVHNGSSVKVYLLVDDVRKLLQKSVEQFSAIHLPASSWELELNFVNLETARAAGGDADLANANKLMGQHGQNVTQVSQIEADENEVMVLQTILRSKQKSRNHWSLYDAIFFAQTIVTTVGYGSIAPITPIGRAASCIYAILGIPVIGVWLAGVGELIFSHVEKLRKKVHIRKCLRTWFLFAHFCLIVLVGSVVFIFLPSLLFSKIEEWSYTDSIYYSVMSLTTIGLGDLVAGAKEDSPHWYRILLNLWLLLGLGWLSMIISLIMHMMRSRATKVINKASEQVALKLRSRVSLQRTVSFSGIHEISVLLPEMERSRNSLRPNNGDNRSIVEVTPEMERQRTSSLTSFFNVVNEECENNEEAIEMLQRASAMTNDAKKSVMKKIADGPRALSTSHKVAFSAYPGHSPSIRITNPRQMLISAYQRSLSVAIASHNNNILTPIIVYNDKAEKFAQLGRHLSLITKRGIVERVQTSAIFLKPRCPSSLDLLSSSLHQQ